MKPKLPQLLLVPLLAMIAGASAGVACTMQSDATPAGGDPEAGGSGASGPEGDGSIDVANDSEPEPAPPPDYSYLCTSETPDARNPGCVPDAEADPCDDMPGDDGGITPGEMTSCQLVADHQGGVYGSCETQGAGAYAAPCQTAADCSAGLGCVPATISTEGNDYGGACRNYCCGDVEACPQDTFCAPQPMIEGTADIPVCIPATNCTLLEEGACEAGLACTIVRADGTTSCVEPGAGLEGEACPCADGYMCAKHINQCKKLCHEDKPEECPTGTTCQGGSMEFPEGIGVCVGADAYK